MCRMISLLPSIHISEQYDSMEETVPQYTKVSKMIFKYFSIKKSPTFLVHAKQSGIVPSPTIYHTILVNRLLTKGICNPAHTQLGSFSPAGHNLSLPPIKSFSSPDLWDFSGLFSEPHLVQCQYFSSGSIYIVLRVRDPLLCRLHSDQYLCFYQS